MASLGAKIARMTAAELAAYIGATAWLPQIGTWFYKWLSTPLLTILPERSVEIGFTSFGPIFNLRLALSADRKDIVLDDFVVELVHQDGEKHTLRWVGMREDVAQTQDASGTQQGRITKEQVPIALKISTVVLVEKFMRFQEPRFTASHDAVIQTLVEHFSFLKATDADYVNSTLKSKEFHAVVDTRTKSFWWKPGRYEITLKPAAPRRLKVRGQRYSFTKTPSNIDRLGQNLPTLKSEIENTIKSNNTDFEVPTLTWIWEYPSLTKIN